MSMHNIHKQSYCHS